MRLGGFRIDSAGLAHRAPDRSEALGEITLDVEVPLHVGAGHPDLARRPHDVPQRPLAADDEHRPAVESGFAAVPRAQTDRETETHGVLSQGEQAASDVHRSIELLLVVSRHLNVLSPIGAAGMLKP